MNEITLERYYHDPALRRELEAAARRERARHMERLLEHSKRLLLGRQSEAAPEPQPRQCCAQGRGCSPAEYASP